jgi:restriction system protein
MELPKYHETFIPILEVLKDGQEMHYNALRQAVRDAYYADLPPELLARKTKGGDPLILNRIGWGKAYLKQAKMVHQPTRAIVQITDKGRKILAGGRLSLRELLNDPDFQAHRLEKAQQKTVATATTANSSPQDLIDSGIEELEEQLKADLLERLRALDPYFFEKVELRLFQTMGYGDFVETAKSGDGGIDGIVNQDQLGIEKIYVQAKRYADNKVRESHLRNFIGAISRDTTKGIFVTTSSFDAAAITKAKDASQNIILIDGQRLVDLMHRYNVGVQVVHTYEVKEIDEDFFEE